MQYEIEIDGRTRQVVVTRVGDRFTVSVDGRTSHVNATRIDAYTLSLLIDPEVRLKPDTTGDATVGPKPDTTGDATVRLKPDTTGDANVRLKPDTTGDPNVRLKPDITGDATVGPKPDTLDDRALTPVVSGFSRTHDRSRTNGISGSHEVTIAPDPATRQLTVRVGTMPIGVSLNGRRRWGRKDDVAHAASGPQRIVAPMPGKIVRVLVKPGDPVRARQGLVVIEAMKMENELRAARDGTVTEVQAREAASVEAGAVLVVIA
jgi:biotin carboxyl carrier protein